MKILGHGIYSVPEAARYIGMNYNTLHSWFRSANKVSVLQTDYAELKTPTALSFYDLIDAWVVKEFRDMGVTMHHIRQVHLKLSKELKTPHPFCRQGFFVDTQICKIFTDRREHSKTEFFTDALKNQGHFSEVLAPHLKAIDYDLATKMATCWHIGEGVVINPEISLGKPVIKGTGVTTFVLAKSYYANGKDAEFAAELFDVNEADVMNAVCFEITRGVVKKAA